MSSLRQLLKEAIDLPCSHRLERGYDPVADPAIDHPLELADPSETIRRRRRHR